MSGLEWPDKPRLVQSFGPAPGNFQPAGHMTPHPMDWAILVPAALLSPDCRDGNCRKCDGVAWNLAADAPDTCGCACHGESPASP